MHVCHCWVLSCSLVAALCSPAALSGRLLQVTNVFVPPGVKVTVLQAGGKPLGTPLLGASGNGTLYSVADNPAYNNGTAWALVSVL